MEPRKDFVDNRETNNASCPADGAARVSNRRHRIGFETAQDGILIIDAATGRIIDVNPFIVEMLGYSYEQLLGKKLHEISPFRDTRANLSAFQELRDKGYLRYEHLPLEAKDGRKVDVEFVSNTYWVNHKRLIQCNIRDIKERKKSEETKSKIESRLQQAQHREALATLAGGVAHQFNNALMAITGTLDLLAMDVPDSGNVSWYLGSIRQSALRMTQLTRQLLAYARGGAYEVESISLSAFVRDTLPFLTPGLKPTVHIETDLPDDVQNTRVDAIQMQMVLLAILSNASDAINGQGYIRITCKNDIIAEKDAKDFPRLMVGSYVCMTIADNGKGMDKETRRKIFEPFFSWR